ncbi:MAG: YqaJ viral recombinase family protein [Oscillospiraceae bacterium]|nr:YqaJ viral recombinase family protein [Oscillospiraceae bacterium]
MAIEKIPIHDMDREEWVAARKGSVGGSDAATLLGMNPYSSPYALWAEKTGAMEPEDISGKEAVRLGNVLEPYVAQRFTEITGKKVRRENYILKNTDYPFAHANVDRLVIGEKAGLECKTTSVLNLSKFAGGEFPANYYCQCMHYMAVTGYEKWYLAVLIGNQEVRVFEILRDEEEIAALMEAEREFWDHVVRNVPPPVDGMKATGRTLDALHSDSGREADLAPVCRDLREYLDLKAQMKELERKLEHAANAIKSFMGDASRGSYGELKVDWKAVTSKRFDKTAFQRDHPGIDLGPYHKASTSRRFEVKG